MPIMTMSNSGARALRSALDEQQEKADPAMTRKLRDVETLPKTDATALLGLESVGLREEAEGAEDA